MERWMDRPIYYVNLWVQWATTKHYQNLTIFGCWCYPKGTEERVETLITAHFGSSVSLYYTSTCSPCIFSHSHAESYIEFMSLNCVMADGAAGTRGETEGCDFMALLCSYDLIMFVVFLWLHILINRILPFPSNWTLPWKSQEVLSWASVFISLSLQCRCSLSVCLSGV